MRLMTEGVYRAPLELVGVINARNNIRPFSNPPPGVGKKPVQGPEQTDHGWRL